MLKCPNCESKSLDTICTDLIAMIVDVECLECRCEFKLRIEDEPYDIIEASVESYEDE